MPTAVCGRSGWGRACAALAGCARRTPKPSSRPWPQPWTRSSHTALDVPMTTLLKVILRMRPDRILVGEVRGAEALDLLDAWNTGHEGGAATLHANSALAGLTRLKSLITRNEAAPSEIEPL